MKFEYVCTKCGNAVMLPRQEDGIVLECDSCSGILKKAVSKNVGIIFKGSGFYSNDRNR